MHLQSKVTQLFFGNYDCRQTRPYLGMGGKPIRKEVIRQYHIILVLYDPLLSWILFKIAREQMDQ